MDTRPNENNRHPRLRPIVRLAAPLIAAILLLPILPWPSASMLVPASSPYIAIASAIAVRSLSTATFIGLPILLIVLLRRRWFCRWICPLGLSLEYAARHSPASPSRCKRIPPIGKALVALTIPGACIGYPLLLCLDPLAIFTSLFSLADNPLARTGWVAAAILLLIFTLTITLPGAWCLKLCPLGAAQDLLSLASDRLRRAKRNPTSSTDPAPQTHASLPRRSILTITLAALCAAAGTRIAFAARAARKNKPPKTLRPPASVDDWQLEQLCIRCGNCARACPAHIIRPDSRPERIAGWLTPIVVFDADYCREDCDACMRVCPSGAIPRKTLQAKTQNPIGLARVDMDSCLLALNRECPTMCLTACPYDAITLHEWSFEDDRRFPVIHPDKCPGCGACAIACTPMTAITITPPERQIPDRTEKELTT